MPAPTVLNPTDRPPVTPPAPPGEEPFLTSAEVAAWLRISEAAFRQWRKRGIAPPHEAIPSGIIRYRPSAVRDWLAAEQKRRLAGSH